MQSEGLKIVISGPSGAGKGTIVKELIKEDNILVSISATTRAPRQGEEEGVHYFFKTKDDFEKMITNNELIEYASFCNNYYGTPKSFVESSIKEGKDVILEIEVQGAMQVKDMYPDAIFVFVMPPDLKELKSRLVGRNTETQEVIEKRMQRAQEELKLYTEYGYVVINDELDQSVASVQSIIAAEKMKSYRYKEYIQQILDK